MTQAQKDARRNECINEIDLRRIAARAVGCAVEKVGIVPQSWLDSNRAYKEDRKKNVPLDTKGRRYLGLHTLPLMAEVDMVVAGANRAYPRMASVKGHIMGEQPSHTPYTELPNNGNDTAPPEIYYRPRPTLPKVSYGGDIHGKAMADARAPG